jgi:radical SAM superfamily enzyme
MSHTYLTANVYCRRLFGSKVYKLALSAATGCPNRDGTVGMGGCVFCSAGGSGGFRRVGCASGFAADRGSEADTRP